MKAAILYGAHDFRIEERDRPGIQENQCLIKVETCGVCHSEIFQWDKKIEGLEYPRFIGHEVSGRILKTGPGASKFTQGDRVAVWTDGRGYAEEVAVDEKFIFQLDESVSFEEALAEPIGCTTNGVLKSNVALNDTVALVGTGFMGLIMLQELRLLGADKIIAVDVRDEMLELALKLGADIVLNPQKVKVQDEIRNLTEGKGVDIGFEIGGNTETLNLTADLVRMEGKLVIFGFHPGPRQIKDLGFWNWMAFDIINGHFRNEATIVRGTALGMDLLNKGKINMKPLITHTFSLDEIENAFDTAHHKPPGFIKAVLKME